MGDQGWTDEQMVMSLVLLNVAGGDCVDDLRVLEGDEGLCRVLREVEDWRPDRIVRSERLRRRWRKDKTRTVPSPTAMREYLELFHDEEQEKLRSRIRRLFLRPPKLLDGLVRVNAAFVAGVQRRISAENGDLGHGCHVGGDIQEGGAVLLQETQGISAVEHLLGGTGACALQRVS